MNGPDAQDTQLNQAPKKSAASEELIRDMLHEDAAFRQAQRERVALAKQNTPDKQPFDIEAFGGLYNLRDDDGQLRISPELVESYEAEYYLKNPDVKSLAEFAELRKKLDTEASQ